MTSAHPLPVEIAAGGQESERTLGGGQAAVESLVPAHLPRETGSQGSMSLMAQLPVELEVSLPIRQFRVRNLLALEPGQVIETRWGHAGDLPLAAGDVQLAWGEFEVVNSGLAVRLTRLA